VVRDAHDALTYGGVAAVFVGVTGEFGLWWALIAAGLVLLAFAFKGLR
jgi:hypothetical protein